jgi:hypothetical protein
MTEITATPETAPTGHGYAYCCEVCDATDPHWYIMRRGDVVISWACDPHLAEVCTRLQRDREVTELIVTDSRKNRARLAAGHPATAPVVSSCPGDWTPEQARKAAIYGTCQTCGAPRDTARSELEPGAVMLEFVCLNGHRGPGV